MSDILEQFGFVIFDRDGAYVVSHPPSKTACLVSKIGERTQDRLFSFDKEALSSHAAGMKARGMVPSKQGHASRWLTTMGARGSSVIPRHRGDAHGAPEVFGGSQNTGHMSAGLARMVGLP